MVDYSRYKCIRFEKAERILAATLNRPESLNSVTAEMHEELAEMFSEALGPEEYAKLIKTTSPEFEFFRAIEGNLSEVGWTQKFTGAAKAAEAKLGSTFLTRVAEDLYPKAKFHAKEKALLEAIEAEVARQYAAENEG